MADREYLFNYRFDGAEWGISIHAASPAEAKEKIKAVALARYEGELAMRIPVLPGAGIFTRALTWLLNTRWMRRLNG
jgi:hypothetical protein